MKKLLFLFIALSLFACDKNDDVTLEKHVVGKWGVYAETDVNHTDPLGAFEFKSNGELYVYSSIDFNITESIKFKWLINSNNQIEIVLQGDPITQGNQIIFPNGVQQGDLIMIPVDTWSQGDPIMAISVYGIKYHLVKID